MLKVPLCFLGLRLKQIGKFNQKDGRNFIQFIDEREDERTLTAGVDRKLMNMDPFNKGSKGNLDLAPNPSFFFFPFHMHFRHFKIY